jgi:hypothetical protein
MADVKLTPQQRAANFSLATRQYIQKLPTLQFAEGQTLTLQIPKTRFMSKLYLQVNGSFKTTHASKTTFTKSVFDKYNILKQIRMSINSGFNPYQLSGSMLRMYNLINNFKNPTLGSDVNSVEVLGNTVSSEGATNKIAFTLELPITINDRDTVGLIMLQNEQTLVTLNIDCDTLANALMTDIDIAVSNVNISITPVLETFSIPSVPSAIPDYSIIKVVNQQVQNVVSAGEMTISLPTSLTYRKLFIYLASDTKYTPVDSALIDSFQLVFNQADTPYDVPADFLEYKNKVDYQGSLPAGLYVLDLSNQGIANYGGARDYIDTERLTEFWLKIRFNNISGNSNYVYVVGEKLAKLV